MKKYGTREEVMAETAEMTKAGIVKADMVVLDGKIRTKKEVEQQKLRKEKLLNVSANGSERGAEKAASEAASERERERKAAPKSQHEDEDADDESSAKAVPKSAYSLNDLRDLVQVYVAENNKILPRGTSRWKKADWLKCATELKLI